MTYIFKYKIGNKPHRVETRSFVRFVHQTRLIKWKKCIIMQVPVSLRVIYGYFKDYRNKTILFDNQGDYYNKHDFLQALSAFREV